MPKKRNHLKSFKPSSPASPSNWTSTSHNSTDKVPATKSVNDLLANLRRTSAGSSSSSSLRGGEPLPATTPSVPPAIREILQIPEAPAPAPRRPVRARYDASGRRLPAGPPPPRSWVQARGGHRSSAPSGSSSLLSLSALGISDREDGASSSAASRKLKASAHSLDQATLPGAHLPARGSLIDLVLRGVALDWEFHRVYNQYHIYFIPNHLKPPLIRLIGLSNGGVSGADLRAILLPPVDAYEEEDDAGEGGDDHPAWQESISTTVEGVTSLDLTGSLGSSIKLKELADLLFPLRKETSHEEPEPLESWDAAAGTAASWAPPRSLLPNLTHLSLALKPGDPSGGGSWKQLLTFSTRAANITHLSLAFWPEPCLTPNARRSTVTSPQSAGGGRGIAYSGTSYYSHTLDQDWSEAILVLRRLCRNFYELEFLDLTGCSSWFHALMAESDHDRVDWTGSWGKISHLRLYNGWKLHQDSSISEEAAFAEGMRTAARVEKHIRTMRAGQGRFINVERDRLPV